MRYNERLKAVADVDFVYRLLRGGFRGGHVQKFVAAFALTGANLGESAATKNERKQYETETLPAWFAVAKPFLKIGFYAARFWFGTTRQKRPLTYRIYRGRDTARTAITVQNPTYKWKK